MMLNMQQTGPMINPVQRNNKKFVEMAQKANSSMLASQQQQQQMLVSQFQKQPKMGQEIRESFDGSVVVTNGSNNRASNSNVAHAGSRSSKNAIGMSNLSSFNTANGPTPQAPSNPNGGSSHKNNSSSSKRKTSKKISN
jgi:hypothetical protein